MRSGRRPQLGATASLLLALCLIAASALADPTSNPKEIAKSEPSSGKEACVAWHGRTAHAWASPCSWSSSFHAPPAVCKVAIEVSDPVCRNGGYLRAENITDEPTSCGECMCPQGWTGVDCGGELSLKGKPDGREDCSGQG